MEDGDSTCTRPQTGWNQADDKDAQSITSYLTTNPPEESPQAAALMQNVLQNLP